MRNIMILIIIFMSMQESASAQEIKLLFGGDVTFGENYHSIANVRDNYGYSFEKISAIIACSDYFVVNLETSVTEYDKKTPKKFNFKTRKSDLEILRRGGVDAVTLANNHTFDYGKKGLFDTFKALEDYGIAYFGAGRTYESARKSHRVVIDGVRISFLAYGNDENVSALTYIPHRYKEDVEDAVRLEKQNSDIVVVFFHWGVELDAKPRQEEVLLAHKCINRGADIIIGSHPHVTQTIEVYKGKPICYSLGNLIFGGNRKGVKTGMLFMVTVKNKNVYGEKIMLCVDPVETNYQPYIIKK